MRASSSEGVEELKRERGGRRVCIICEAPLPARKRVLCGDLECKRTYFNIWSADTLLKRPS